MYFFEYGTQQGTAYGYEVKSRLEVQQSEFQAIEIYETKHHGHLMVIDGFNMLTTRDNYFYHEVMAHSPIVAHPKAENVLIIGGGDCGTLCEVLKHPQIKKCTQVDIDKVVTEMALKYFPELTEKNNDPRAEILFDDGVAWVKNASSKTYDVIIIDSTDPIGPGEGLFNLEFHQECLRALKDDGILIQQSESPLFQRHILTGITDNFKNAGFEDIQTLAFPQPCYPSGLWSATIASKKKIDWDKNLSLLEQAQGTRKYLNAHMLKSLVLQAPYWPSEHVF